MLSTKILIGGSLIKWWRSFAAMSQLGKIIGNAGFYTMKPSISNKISQLRTGIYVGRRLADFLSQMKCRTQRN